MPIECCPQRASVSPDCLPCEIWRCYWSARHTSAAGVWAAGRGQVTGGGSVRRGTAETTAPGTWDFPVELRSDPASAEARAEVLAKPSFGQAFTDHMVVANWTVDRGWHDSKVTAYAPLTLSPAAA